MVNNFRGRQSEHEHSHMDSLAQMPMISIPRVESPLEKVMSTQRISFEKSKYSGSFANFSGMINVSNTLYWKVK